MTKTFIRDIATRLTALFALSLLLSACGGGGGGGGGAVSFAVTGTAQKGPYVAGAVVTAWRLDASTGARTTTSLVSATDANGNFNVAAIPWTGLTEIHVAGGYFNEVANTVSAGSLGLSALADLQGNATVRVNLYTHLLAGRIRSLMATGQSYAVARTRALAELSGRFSLNLSGAVGPEVLDMTDGAGAHRQDNANLLLFSAAFLAGGIDTQAEIDAVRDDFARSGRIDGAALDAIKTAADGLNLDTMRGYLVARYGGDAPGSTDLPTRPAWTSGGLNDTGAALCSNGVSNAACPATDYPGQDAQSGRDSNSLTNGDADGRAGFSYTKLDNAGNPLAINAVSWACVRDNVTGLMWEAKTIGGVQGKDNAYTYANAEAYVATVNALPTPLCGYTDWRLPTPQELASQVDSSLSAGTVAVVTAFPEQKAAAYWSSLANKGDATRAWFVEFSVGLFGHQPKDGSDGTGHVRLVRSTVAPPATRYTANGDGTLIDHQTGLMWRECSDGLTGDKCASGAAQSHTWQDALQRVAAVNANPAGLGLGYGDWRLPNRNELGSIIDYSRRDPAIDRAKFVGVRAVGYWTSTPDASNPGRAWFVDMKDGGTAFASQDDVQGKPILLVRDL